MGNLEGANLEQSLARQYALEVFGKDVIEQVFQGETSDVQLVEMEERPPFTELANGRPFFDRLIQPGAILTTREKKKTFFNRPMALIERLNLSIVPPKRRQDLGGIIGDELKFGDDTKKEEWSGAGLELLAETRAQFAAAVDSPVYESLIGKSIFFAGVLLAGRRGTYVPSINVRGGGPRIGVAEFQADYDVAEGEWAVARGRGIVTKRPLEK